MRGRIAEACCQIRTIKAETKTILICSYMELQIGTSEVNIFAIAFFNKSNETNLNKKTGPLLRPVLIDKVLN